MCWIRLSKVISIQQHLEKKFFCYSYQYSAHTNNLLVNLMEQSDNNKQLQKAPDKWTAYEIPTIS
jgi:hypothetical protein